MTFTKAKEKFDKEFGMIPEYSCFLPEHLSVGKTVQLQKKDGTKNEQYYKWQFLYSLVNSGLFPKDLIGTEVHFPKGNKDAANIKIDAAVFTDASWWDKYVDYHTNNNADSLEWLRNNLIVAIEFKKEGSKNLQEVWDKQLKAYMKESEADFCLGILYDTERLYLFRRYNNKYLRFSDEYNIKGEASTSKDISLHLPDPYTNIPSFDRTLNWVCLKSVDRAKRVVDDLEVISGIQSSQVNDSMSAILRTLDKFGMLDQKGFEILIQILSLKIYDEKRNEKQPSKFLDFYILPEEKQFNTLADSQIQKFIKRISLLKDEACGLYHRILKENLLNLKEVKHVRVLIEVVTQFQDYSFVKSQKTDLSYTGIGRHIY